MLLKAKHTQFKRSTIFSNFESDYSRVARLPTAGQGKRRPWVRGVYPGRFSSNARVKGKARESRLS